jgi:hypothetical protein
MVVLQGRRKCQRASSIGRRADKGAVKIGAEQTNASHRRESYTTHLIGQFFCEVAPSWITLDSMKSAIELAMSRLDKASPIRKMTDGQKSRIAEVDSEITAKIAEKKVFLNGEIAKAAGDPQAQEELRRQLAGELARLEEKREEKKEKIRNESAA